tara:strand:+ start:1850 stop:2002 length:153 start_codon:yes stop_codon:yes gene_type:complete
MSSTDMKRKFGFEPSTELRARKLTTGGGTLCAPKGKMKKVNYRMRIPLDL